MKTKNICSVSSFVFASLALVACEDAGSPIDGEPGEAYEVFHQDSEGTQHTLGFFEPGEDRFAQVKVDWDYAGYSFEADNETVEVLRNEAMGDSDVPLELGATYDATLSLRTGDSVTEGFIAVDTFPADRGSFEAAYGGCTSVHKTFEEYWDSARNKCLNVYTTWCGRSVYRRRTVEVGWWNC